MTSPQARPAMRRLSRLRIAVVAASAVVLVGAAGIGAVLAADPGAVQYTGCLDRTTGIPYFVRVGLTPLHSCHGRDPVASWNNIGPAGASGTNGVNGTNGTNGVDGKDGAPGLKGDQGNPGAPGGPGNPGLDGAPGKDGSSLTQVALDPTDLRCGVPGGYEIFSKPPNPNDPPTSQGVLCNGANGKDGTNGTDGKDGAAGAQGPAGGAVGFGTTATPNSGTGDTCTLGEITLTAAFYGYGVPAAGQILSINQNTALFSLLGTTYGGNGQTTFALPDLRDVTPQAKGGHPLIYAICINGVFPAQQ